MKIEIKNVQGIVIATLDAESIPSAMEILASRGTSLAGADCRGMNLAGRHLEGLQCPNANFSNATLDQARMNQAHLANATFTNASFDRTHLSEANLKNATFSGVDIRGIIALHKMDMSVADLTRLATLAASDPRSFSFQPTPFSFQPTR